MLISTLSYYTTELYKEYSRQGRAYAMQNCRTEYAVDQLEKYIQDLM